MSLKYLKFAVFCCLVAGFSPVRGDDKNVAVASKDVFFRKHIKYSGCTCGKVAIARADCGPPPPGCRYESTMTECCKKICDLGCTYNDILIPEGETRTVAPCQYGTCSGGKVEIAIAGCPRPEDGCRYESTMTECCNKICDLGCTYNDIFIAEGQTETVAPCEYGTCVNGEVMIMVADCGPFEEGCRFESTMTECCKKICNEGCTYNDIFIPEGENRPIAPCEYGYCNGGKLDIMIRDCATPPPNCHLASTLEECCKYVCDPCDGPIEELIDVTAAH